MAAEVIAELHDALPDEYKSGNDEPTSALDPELVGEVLATMLQLAAEGMTMVVVADEMLFARDVADQLIFMDEGAMDEQGNPRDLLSNPPHERTRSFLARVLTDA